MPSIILGGIALGTQLYSGYQQSELADRQAAAAAKLKLRDNTPGALVEALDMGRQEAGSARLPGQAQEEARIAQQTGNVSQAAVRAGTSSTQIQAALAGADARGQSALSDLGRRALAYRDQARMRFTGLLSQKAQQQRADQQAFEREKAALLEGSDRNGFNAGQSISNGVAGAASIMAQGGSFSGGGGGYSAAQNGALDALTPRPGVLGPTGLPSLPAQLPLMAPAPKTGGYSPIGAPGYDPFKYGRY